MKDDVKVLQEMKDALCEPFPIEVIQFLPKRPKKDQQGQWTCLALPYADKRVYEDQLNRLAFGAWSTPYTPPLVAGNKLVIPVTVVIHGVPHTDFGEAFLHSKTREGEDREEENSATEAYSQAFRRACAQFGLGRYLYGLPKKWLPYDPRTKRIVLSTEERLSAVQALYVKAGLKVQPRKRDTTQLDRQQIDAGNAGKDHVSPSASVTSSSHGVPAAGATAPRSITSITPQGASSAHQQHAQQRAQHGASDRSHQVSQASQVSQVSQADRVDDRLLAYLRRTLDAKQMSQTLTYYGIRNLADLTASQAQQVARLLDRVKSDKQNNGSAS
jgi:hypothetical protein